MVEITYREAIVAALREEMQRDENVILMGEDIGESGGPFKTTDGLFTEFGGDRVRDTPISENAFVGAALGMAVTGLRPVVELMFADFMAVCYDQIGNSIAKHRFMCGGELKLPLVIRAMGGGGIRFGAQHTQTGEGWLLPFPGLVVLVPSSPTDAYDMLKYAVRSDNPVLVLEHKGLMNVKGDVEVGRDSAPLRIDPKIKREGSDVSVVASLAMVPRALEAADRLAQEGIELEVIDLSRLRPMDTTIAAQSVRKTNRLVVVEENHRPGGWGGEVSSAVLTEAFDFFDAPPELVSLPDWPMPYSPDLEDSAIPSVEKIIDAVRTTLA